MKSISWVSFQRFGVTVSSSPFSASTATCSPASSCDPSLECCVPQLAVDDDELALAHLAGHADERLRTGRHRPAAGGDSLAGDKEPEGGDRKADADDEPGVDPVGRRRVGEEQR